MHYDIIVAGELNVDLLLNGMTVFPSVGAEILADKMQLALGSSSAIFASNLSTLGASVGFMGRVGDDDFGTFCLHCLEQKNVGVSRIRKDKENGTGLTVVMNYGEDRAMVTYQGAMKNFCLDDIDFDSLARAKHLHFASYYLQPAMALQVHVLFKKAKELGLTVSFDPQSDPDDKWEMDLKKILPYVDVFLPNMGEFKALTGTDNWQKALADLGGHANIIAIKAGANGSYVFHNNEIHHCEPYLNNQVVDAIGAGDSFNAGFIYQFVKGMPVKKCQQFGNLTGSLSTTAAGGTGAFTSREALKTLAAEKFDYVDF